MIQNVKYFVHSCNKLCLINKNLSKAIEVKCKILWSSINPENVLQNDIPIEITEIYLLKILATLI